MDRLGQFSKYLIMFQNLKLTLISTSPRRKQLLKEVGIHPIIGKIDTDEQIPKGYDLFKAPSFLAKQKVEAYLNIHNINHHSWYLGADTIVVANEQILEKPLNREEAIQSLKKLSGKTHYVITGYYLLNGSTQKVFENNVITKVEFHTLSEPMIQHYVEEYNPYDKAGGYGIQEWIGMVGIKSISGDYYSVMGLPIAEICQNILSTIQ